MKYIYRDGVLYKSDERLQQYLKDCGISTLELTQDQVVQRGYDPSKAVWHSASKPSETDDDLKYLAQQRQPRRADDIPS